jgi:hypothetical protein
VCLLFDAPHGHPGHRLHPVASQDLAAALYLHKQHTHTKIYSQMEIIHSIIFTNQILHKVFIVSTIKHMYHLTITQILCFEMKFSFCTNDLRYDERR